MRSATIPVAERPSAAKSRAAKLFRVFRWFAAVLVLGILVLLAVLIITGRPADTHSLRFDGFVELPMKAGLLNVFDYMTVVGDDLFVTNAITGAVFRVNLHAHAMPNSADVSVFASDGEPRGVVVDPTSHLAFVTRSNANSVDVFDPKSMRLIKQIPVPKGPDAIFYDPSNKLVYAASGDAKAATLIDPANQTSIGVISLGGSPEFAVFDPETKLMYQNLADTNTLVAVDAAKRMVVQRWSLEGCDYPTGVAIDEANRKLFIACGKNSKLVIFDLNLHSIIATVPVGFGPDSVAYDPDLHRIYVTGLLGKLSVVSQDAANVYHVADSIGLHFEAHTLAIDPATHRLIVGYASLAIPPRLAVFTPNR
jgi:DNA-binding beta-propeller fold protein YncE